jgi:hypothetical protein
MISCPTSPVSTDGKQAAQVPVALLPSFLLLPDGTKVTVPLRGHVRPTNITVCHLHTDTSNQITPSSSSEHSPTAPRATPSFVRTTLTGSHGISTGYLGLTRPPTMFALPTPTARPPFTPFVPTAKCHADPKGRQFAAIRATPQPCKTTTRLNQSFSLEGFHHTCICLLTMPSFPRHPPPTGYTGKTRKLHIFLFLQYILQYILHISRIPCPASFHAGKTKYMSLSAIALQHLLSKSGFHAATAAFLWFHPFVPM